MVHKLRYFTFKKVYITYPKLYNAEPLPNSDVDAYSCAIVFNKDDSENLDRFKKSVKSWYKIATETECDFDTIENKLGNRHFLKDGDTRTTTIKDYKENSDGTLEEIKTLAKDESYAGKYIVNLRKKTTERPFGVQTSKTDIKMGDICNVICTIREFSYMGKKNIKLVLEAVEYLETPDLNIFERAE